MPLVYAITVVVTRAMPKWVDKRVRIIIGIAMNFVAFLCVGPSLLLNFPDSITIMCIGHALAGFFGSQTILLGMLEMIEDGCERFPDKELLVASMSAGAYRGLIGITQMIGPLYGSIVTKYLGFRLAMDIIAFVDLAMAIAYFALAGGPKVFY